MKTKFFFTLLFLSIIYCSNAQEYCGANYSANSVIIRAYCKYCNKSSVYLNIPKIIKFERTLVCNTLNNPSSASPEGTCKLNSIILNINYKYYMNLMMMSVFYEDKCYSGNNPKNKHEAYIEKAEDIGLQEYSFETSEVGAWQNLIESTKSNLGYETYDQLTAQAMMYSIAVVKNSCQ